MKIRYALAVGAATLLGTSAWAGTVTSINIAGDTAASTEGLGDFVGSIMYDTAGILDISLTNTSPLANEGFITGLVFNILGNATATYNPIGGDTFSGVSSESASPFGTFEFGTAIGGNWIGGGNPTSGVEAGDTRNFNFTVAGADTAILSASSFFSELSTNTNDPQVFAVRFKGFKNDGSDKVPGTRTVVPTPSAALAGLIGLGVLGVRRRRRHG